MRFLCVCVLFVGSLLQLNVFLLLFVSLLFLRCNWMPGKFFIYCTSNARFALHPLFSEYWRRLKVFYMVPIVLFVLAQEPCGRSMEFAENVDFSLLQLLLLWIHCLQPIWLLLVFYCCCTACCANRLFSFNTISDSEFGCMRCRFFLHSSSFRALFFCVCCALTRSFCRPVLPPLWPGHIDFYMHITHMLTHAALG